MNLLKSSEFLSVQNGSIGKEGRKGLLEKVRNNSLNEKEKQSFMAKATAEKCNPKYKEDVLSRKLTIVNGVGVVHGKKYNLKSEFNISDCLIKVGGK